MIVYRRTVMNMVKMTLTTMLILGLNTTAHARDYRIFDLGMDGYEHYYRVTCHDPYTEGTVVVKYEEKEGESNTSSGEYTGDQQPVRTATSGDEVSPVVEICMSDASGKTRCKDNWSVSDAAKQLCK